ncbi:MAG: transcription termination/antitermination protein NusG [Patescibacteria group bacterium]
MNDNDENLTENIEELPAETPVPEEIEAAETAPETPTDNPRLRWFVVHVNSGHENKVASTLKQRAVMTGLTDRITQVLIPTQRKIVISEGRKRNIEERLFPGYLLVQMDLDDLTWHTVRNTTGVTGFVGTEGKPTPLSEAEVNSIIKFTEMEAPKYEAKFSLGDSVKIIDGPFTDFMGKVDEVDNEKGKVKVLVSIFGRETPVELDFLQVSPL